MKHLTPFLITLIFLGAGCKARKVALVKTDSVVKTSSSAKVHTETTRKDSTTTKTETHSKTTDTSSSTVTIVPDSGSAITVSTDKGFLFTGKAKSITIKRKNDIITNAGSFITTTGIASITLQKDSTAQSQTKTELHKKVKNVESKPDYSWIAWLVGILLVLFGIWWLWDKFKGKII